MRAVAAVFAILGFLAVVRLAALALFRIVGRGVEAFVAGQVGDTHARRGDVTGLRNADAARTVARRARRSAFALLATSVGLLLLPMLTPWPRWLYVAYVPLWLVSPGPRS